MFTMLRVFCVPVFLFFIFYGGFKPKESFIYVALGVFTFASLTDLFDGAVARKFNQVTELGKVLDPFADKIMHISVLLGLTIIGYVHWAFIVLIALKELIMIVGGIFLVKGGVIVAANMMGKVASFTLSIGVILSFFHPYVYYVDWGIIGLAVVFTYIAFVNYGLDALKSFKQIKAAKTAGAAEENAATNEIIEENDGDGNE